MNLWGSDTAEDFRFPVPQDPDFPPPFSSLVQVELAARTDQGKVRSHNEDSYLIFRTRRSWERLLTSLPDGQLPLSHEEASYVLAVADGMGGHRGGEIASSQALRSGVAMMLNAAQWSQKLDNPAQRKQQIQALIDSGMEYFEHIDRTLATHALADPTLAGMGTTLTVASSFGDDLLILHVGDSRAYLFRDGKLEQLTHDHTLVQAMLDAGSITPEQAAQHSMKHVLTRAIGRGRETRAEVRHCTLVDGDVLLVCSDGLHGMVEDARIAAILAQPQPAEAACQALLDEALAKGGKDNVTILLARYHIPSRERR